MAGARAALTAGGAARSALLALVAALALTAASAPLAWAAFSALVQTTGTSFAAYTVPAPGNLRCAGLDLLRGQLVWDAVTPPPGRTAEYVVTQPDARQVVTSATSYALPSLGLVGTYSVQTRVAGWLSPAVSRSVTTVLGIYVCG